jgi:hypothetical protein
VQTDTRIHTAPVPELLPNLPILTTTSSSFDGNVEATVERIDRALAENASQDAPAFVSAGTNTQFDFAALIAKDLIATAIPAFTADWAKFARALTALPKIEMPQLANLLAIKVPLPALAASDLLALVAHAGKPTNDRTRHLDASLGEIQGWLGIGLDSAADAAGIARGTVYAWRKRGSSPRPATVGAIMRVHGLVSAAVTAAGVERAREWFHAGEPSPLSEMIEANGDPARLRAISARLRRELLRVPVPPPERGMGATTADITE